ATPEYRRASGGSRTHTVRFTKAALGLLSFAGILQGGRWESNPHIPGSQPGPAAVLGSATVLRPGFEPGTRTSQNRVMSVSPSKHQQYPGQESNLDFDLRRIA